MEDFDYPLIPRHWQEAVLIYTALTKRDVDTGARQISPQSIQRLNEYGRISSLYGANKEAAFNSKRRDGVFTRTYISYVDKSGKERKPFLLPQKDPTFYDSCLNTYSVPELIIEPVKIAVRELERAVRTSEKIDIDLPVTTATPKAGKLPTHQDPWQQRE